MFSHEIRDFLLQNNKGVFIVDEQDRIVCHADDFVRDMLGGNPVGRRCYEALLGRSEPCIGCPQLTLETKEPYRWELIRKGEPSRMFLVTNRLFTRNGRVYRIGQLCDVSEYLRLSSELIEYACQMQEETAARAQHDALTGLENRSSLAVRTAGEYRSAGSFGVMFLDVNDMKRINDTEGHDRGDAMLRTAADSIRAVLSDKVHGYRMGGDEFMIVAPDCDSEDIEELHRRWEAALARLNAERGGQPCAVAAGYAWGPAAETLSAIMKRADKAMYRRKTAEKTGPVRKEPHAGV